MKQIYRQQDVAIINNRNVFFDANIIIYLYFASHSTAHLSTVYSGIFQSLLQNGNQLFVDYNILSEVINRELRLCYNIYKENNVMPDDYKVWRNSRDGQRVENRTYAIIRNLLTVFHIEGKIYDRRDMLNMLNVTNQDFTDKAIIALCQEKNFILLTNDKDFSGVDLEILSANTNLV